MTKKIGLPRLLMLGCGDVGLRMLPLLRPHFRVLAVTSRSERCAELRAAGAVPLVADLDRPDSLARLLRLAPTIVHLAPPQSSGEKDRRTRNLAAILPDRARLVYISTTGVYGDCGGALFDETRKVNPQNARARRRVDAEQVLRLWARRSNSRLAILRVPGIYARDRLPLERLQKGTPALAAADDVFTNHIHADDLARIAVAAIFRAMPGRIYHAVDDTRLKMAEYFDAVARAFDMPPPPRLPRSALQQAVTPMMLSFMSESRQLDNRRLKRELGVRLRYATVQDLLASMKKPEPGVPQALVVTAINEAVGEVSSDVSPGEPVTEPAAEKKKGKKGPPSPQMMLF
jgi:nucleoside-diphosphate-sugar epimerase